MFSQSGIALVADQRLACCCGEFVWRTEADTSSSSSTPSSVVHFMLTSESTVINFDSITFLPTHQPPIFTLYFYAPSFSASWDVNETCLSLSSVHLPWLSQKPPKRFPLKIVLSFFSQTVLYFQILLALSSLWRTTLWPAAPLVTLYPLSCCTPVRGSRTRTYQHLFLQHIASAAGCTWYWCCNGDILPC